MPCHFVGFVMLQLFGIWGWSGGAMVLGKLPVPGHPAIRITVGQEPIVLAVGAGGGCLDIFTLISRFSPLSPSLWETARYRRKYCFKGQLNPKQQPTNIFSILELSVKHIRQCFHDLWGTIHHLKLPPDLKYQTLLASKDKLCGVTLLETASGPTAKCT